MANELILQFGVDTAVILPISLAPHPFILTSLMAKKHPQITLYIADDFDIMLRLFKNFRQLPLFQRFLTYIWG